MSRVRRTWLPSRRRRTWFLHAWAIPVAVVAAISLAAFGSTVSRFAAFTHEDRDNYARPVAFIEEMVRGHLHPMIYRDGFGGMGSGFPLFYPPFGTAVSALLARLCGNPVVGANVALFASVFFSGVAFFALARSVSRSRWLALVGAAVYMTAPYRFVDVHVRGAMAECWTFVWWPLLILGVWRVAQGRRMPVFLPVCAAAMILTHPTMALYSALLCVPFALIAVRRAGIPAIARLAVAGAIAAGLSAWFVVPQQAHFPSVKASDPDYMWTSIDAVLRYRVDFDQLFFFDESEWFVGISAKRFPGMCLELGAAVVGCWIVVLGTTGMRRRGDGLREAIGFASAAGFGFCIALMLFPGAVLRLLPGPFEMIQFPWRMLGPAALFSALALAAFCEPFARGRHVRPIALIAIVGLIVAVPGLWKTTNSSAGETAASFSRETLRTLFGKRGFAAIGEHLPREFPLPSQDPVENIEYLLKYEPPPARSLDGNAVVSFEELPDGAWMLRSEASAPDEVVVPLVHYSVRFAHAQDGAPVPLRNREGLVALDVPAGKTTVLFDYGPDKWHRIGAAITAVALALFAMLRLFARRL